MKILVCGSRAEQDRGFVENALNLIVKKYPQITHLIHGGASGVDNLAGDWANLNGIQEVVCPANWNHLGKSAGPIRNLAMLVLDPNIVVAFPGGHGTEDMVRQSKKNGFRIITIKKDDDGITPILEGLEP